MVRFQHIGLISPRSIPFAFREGEPGGGSGAPNPNPELNPVNPPAPNPATPPAKTFTQDDLNKAVAEDRRKLRTENQKLIEQLQSLQTTATLTQQQKEELDARIEQLQTQYQTEAEQKQTEIVKLQKKYDSDTGKLTTDRDTWKQRFEQKSIAVDIAAAASKYDAWSVTQLQAMVGPMTKMVETVDEGGKPTGLLAPVVDFETKDKDGKDIKLQISVDEAVKRMTEMPEVYGNLFKGKGVSGLGQENGAQPLGSGGIPDLASMSIEQYKAKRTQIRGQLQNTK